MTAHQIVCQNCGKKFKIPDTFKGTKSKCTACGAIIDVAAQIAAAASGGSDLGAAKPAAARPAAAKPARARGAAAAADSSGGGTASSTRRAAAGGGRRARAGADEGDGEGGGRRSRRGGGETAEKKGGNNALIFGGLGLVAVIVVVVVFLMGGDDKDPSAENSANAGAANAGANAADAATDSDAGTAGGDAAGDAPADPPPADGGGEAGDAAGQATEAATEKPKEASKPAPSSAASGTPTSRDEVFNPREELDPVAWPDSIDEATRQKVTEMVSQIDSGGIGWIRTKRELVENPLKYPAIFAVVEKLRLVDYFDNDQARVAYELNELLREIFEDVMNAGYRVVEVDTEQSLEDVHWNARTVRAWYRMLDKFPTKQEFQKQIETLRKRNEGK